MSQNLELNLHKPSVQIPWGFRIQGGQDFNRPLIVSRVTCDSIADIQGLKCGDHITHISNYPTNSMTHQQAQQYLVQSGINLLLKINRIVDISVMNQNPQSPRLKIDFTNHKLKNFNVKARKGLSNDVHMTHSNYDLKYKMPICRTCAVQIRGPFVVAMDFCFCPNHFYCNSCGADLTKSGFVEIDGSFFCEKDYRQHLAPICPKCNSSIIGEEVIAMELKWHPHCFVCYRCQIGLGNSLFKIGEDDSNQPYCEKCWNLLFQIRCNKCVQPITIVDKFVEVHKNYYHVNCFCCSACRVPLAGKQYHSRNGKPFCKAHAYAGVLYN